MIFAPILVMLSGVFFIDRREWGMRGLGIGLGIAGFVGIFAFLIVILEADAAERAECVSRGGVPNDGDCWIHGEKR
jgi:Na+-driven multidrug efflux pump